MVYIRAYNWYYGIFHQIGFHVQGGDNGGSLWVAELSVALPHLMEVHGKIVVGDLGRRGRGGEEEEEEEDTLCECVYG